jgi:Protein of unknown function (DUF3592)
VRKIALLTGALRDILLPVGGLCLFAGVTLALTAGQAALEYREAIELQGVVVGKELVRATREQERGTQFVLRIRASLPDGGVVETEEALERKAWEARAVGDAHRVLYLPGKRKTLAPAGSNQFAGYVIMGAVGGVLAILGAALLRRPIGRVFARRRLLAQGAQATASVSEVFQTSTAVNRVILWQLRYRYRDAHGAEHEAESDLMTPGEAAAWRAGESGPILYDPARPASSVWLGSAAEPAVRQSQAWSAAKRLARWVFNLALFFAALFAAAVIGELVPELKTADAWLAGQRTPLALAAAGAALLGLFLLIGAVIAMLMEGGEPMGRTDIENQQRVLRDAMQGPQTWRMSTYRFFGAGAGSSGHDEFPLRELKLAIASGAILGDPVWRRRLCAVCGGMLIFLGVFGAFIVLAPLALKLLLAAVVLYVLVRIAWAFARA